jgi:hypothetical protein
MEHTRCGEGESVGGERRACARTTGRRPERRGAAAGPAVCGCSRTGGARGGPRALPLTGEAGHRVLFLASEVGVGV